MPESGAANVGGGKELGKTPATNGPTSPEAKKGKGGTKPEEKADGEREHAQRESARRAGELRRELGEAREFTHRTLEQAKTPDDKKISFADAASIAEIAEAVGKKTGAVIHPDQIASFKRILQDFGGYNAAAVSEMDNAAIIVAAYEVLKTALVDRAKIKDIKIADKAGREAEIARLEGLIDNAKASKERISKESVDEYITVEGFDYGEAEGSGPGTQEVPTPAETQIENAREIIARMKLLVRMGRNIPEDPDWVDYSRRLQAAIGEFNTAIAERRFLRVHDFVSTIDDAVYTAEHYEPPMPAPDGRQAINLLNSFLPEGDRLRFKNEKDHLDEEFGRVYMRMDDRTRKIVLEDLELALGTQVQGIIAGWNKPDNVRAYIFGGPYIQYDDQGRVIGRAISEGVVGEISREFERGLGNDVVGTREWRATKEIYGAEERVSIELLTRPPARWQEVPERITRIYRFIEKGEFTVEELQASLQKALQMLESIQTDDPEGRAILDELNAEFKAFQAFHMFRVTLERESMAASDSVIGVFKNYFDDETWPSFVKRFSHDSRLREFVSSTSRDRDGNPVKINLLDEAWKVYLSELQSDRRRMNAVEEMSKRRLDLNTNNIDEMWIILKMVHDSESFDELILETEEDCRNALRNLTPDQIRRLNVWGLDLGQEGSRTKEAVSQWYKRRTLLGAQKKAMEGVRVDENGRRVKYMVDLLNHRRSQMRENLKQVLRNMGLSVEDQDDTGKLLEELDKQGFLEAVDSNAYNLAWAFAWSDFDIVRIYGVERKSGKVRKVPQAIAYNQATQMFYGRHTDHFMDFIIDEERGRGYEENEVNAIFRKHLLGEHGNLFPQNRTMVRFARNFMTSDQLAEVERRAQALMKKHDFVPDGSYRELLEKDLQREREEHPENVERDPYFEGFLGWAKSAAIGEMIDSGEFGSNDPNKFSFASKGFSEVAGSIGQFEMIDLYSDRKAALHYMSRPKLQGFLRDPSEERFLAVNDKDEEFYSGRNIRLWPWMKIATEIMWEIAHKHYKRLLDRENWKSGTGENLVIKLIDNGVVRKGQGNYLKRKLFGLGPGVLGTVPFRRARQYTEVATFGVVETFESPGFYFGTIFDFFKHLFGYLFSK